MNGADLVIIAVLLISALVGTLRGLIRETFAIACWIIAFVVAFRFRDSLGMYLAELIETPSLRQLTAMLLLFVSCLLLGGLIGYLCGLLVKATGLTATDRMMGFVFGLARGVLVVLLAVSFLPSMVSIDRDQWWQESVLVPKFVAMEHHGVSLFEGTRQLILNLVQE